MFEMSLVFLTVMGMIKKLRPYQQEAIDRVRDASLVGRKRGIINFATGLGKSFTAAKITENLFPMTLNRTLFIAPARSLVWQMAQNYRSDYPTLQYGATLRDGIVPGLGIVMGRHDDHNARVVVSSVQTLLDKIAMEEERNNKPITRSDIVIDRYGKISLNPNSDRRVLVSERFDRMLKSGGLFNCYIFDEAHHAVAEETLRMFKRIQELHEVSNQEAPNIIGLTATPIRWDGVALANLFETIYIQRNFRWAQRNGYLVPFADPIQINIESNSAENHKDLIMKTAHNWESVVLDAWHKVASDRQTIAFTSPINGMGGVETAKELCKYFLESGIPCAQIDGQGCIGPDGNTMSVNDRGELFQMFLDRRIRILFMYGVGLEGLDLPNADCLFWMRNTDNAPLMTQAVGRILRTHPGKEDALIVDFTGSGVSVSTMGTLLGLMIDPDEEKPPEDEEDEEDLLEVDEGVSLFDLKQDNTLIADGVVINVGKIINKQGNDWYHDAESNSMSLQINNSDSLIIKYPNYTLQAKCQDMMNAMSQEDNIFAKDSLYWRVNNNTSKMNQDDFHKWFSLLEWIEQYASQFSLWHIKSRGLETTIHNNAYAIADRSLDVLLTQSSRYAHQNIENRADFLVDRSKRWSGKATQRQRVLLKNLGHTEADAPDLKKKEASKMINHVKTYRPIIKFEESINQRLSQLGE